MSVKVIHPKVMLHQRGSGGNNLYVIADGYDVELWNKIISDDKESLELYADMKKLMHKLSCGISVKRDGKILGRIILCFVDEERED